MSVIVCGALHLDLVVTAPHLPAPDETVTGSALTRVFGGKGGNQAVAAARMGARSEMAGRVGNDDFAAPLLAALDAAGVGRGQVVAVPGPSGMSVAIVDAQGSYGAVIVSGANLTHDGRIALPGDATHLLLQNEIPAAANLRAATRARAAGARVIVNAAPARAPDPALLPLIDLLVVNRVEAAQLLGHGGAEDPRRAAPALAAQGPRQVIVTLGGDGLVLHDDAGTIHLPARPVTVQSTHGAGDACIGALAAALDGGADLRAACAFATSAAALHVATPPEGRAAITPDRVRAF
ncbi:MAG: bifunctional hydroxymethylpyrimidine kinase/phosphomethylpyrimidine kinase [Rubellimicrobium sp.]|nr:bifunctional hydroxymethylpyrimidine kinase/phosphomethylpyrimidine kinase [Rubellimicrobium sp.]